MPKSMWNASIRFGLVDIPVKMYPAVREHTIRFHRMSPDGTCRLRSKLYCPETGREYAVEETVRGYEVGEDRYAVLSEEEIGSIRPESRHTIEIEDFVSLEEIDPIWYDHPYYLVPGEGGSHSYRLLIEAMTRSDKVAIARFGFREKQNLGALRVSRGGLCLSTMRYHDEVLPLSGSGELASLPDEPLDAHQIELALRLVGMFTRPFDPERYEDDFRDELRALVARKARGEEIAVRPVPEDAEPEIVDLTEALERSLGAKSA